MNIDVIGWDVGGANLKAVFLDRNGNILDVLQVPCALWRGLNELNVAVDRVLAAFPKKQALHAITMTGELVDFFSNRKEGVKRISCLMASKLKGDKFFYSGTLNAGFSRFVTIDQVDEHWESIASANWLASVCFIASRLEMLKQTKNGLLIDIGSTTSDFVLIENSQPNFLGLSDAERLKSEELVYTGVARTPLMAVAQKIKFNNCFYGVAAEFFSTTSDVYRLTSQLDALDDLSDTADNNEKSTLASARRIARMIGHDVDDLNINPWVALALEFKQHQTSRLKLVAETHISRLKDNSQRLNFSIIGAGVGSFLAKEIAETLGIKYIGIEVFTKLNTIYNHDISICLPAYAVASLVLDSAVNCSGSPELN